MSDRRGKKHFSRAPRQRMEFGLAFEFVERVICLFLSCSLSLLILAMLLFKHSRSLSLMSFQRCNKAATRARKRMSWPRHQYRCELARNKKEGTTEHIQITIQQIKLIWNIEHAGKFFAIFSRLLHCSFTTNSKYVVASVICSLRSNGAWSENALARDDWGENGDPRCA